MKIVDTYFFKDPDQTIRSRHADDWADIGRAISALDAAHYRIRLSKEKTEQGRILYRTTALNKAFRSAFAALGWKNVRVQPGDVVQHYIVGYLPPPTKRSGHDLDFIKNRLALQLQFGRYYFMVENVAARINTLNDLGIVEAGVEIVPVKEFTIQKYTGMSHFEQFVSDLEREGSQYLNTPLLILGIAP